MKKVNVWRKALNIDLKHYRKRKVRWESAESWERFISEYFSMNFDSFKDKRILEIGCGAFGAIHYINAPCFRVGIDPLCYAHNDIYKRRSTHTHHVTGIGEYLPFKKEIFDLVISFNVIDHGISPENVINEAKRSLKKSGLFLLHMYTFNLPKFIRSKLWIIDKPHPHHLSDREILLYLKNAGFNTEYHNTDKMSIKYSFSNFITQFDRHSLKYFVASLLGIKNSVYRCKVQK